MAPPFGVGFECSAQPLQGRKSLRLCLAGLRIRRFDPVAKLSELPDHLPSTPLLRFFGDRWAPFFVTNSLMQDEPDQSTLSMSNGPDGLIVSQARHQSAIDDLENGSFRLGCGVGTLIENAPHMAIALRGAVALGYSRALVLSWARSHPGREVLGRSECRGPGAHFGNDLLR